MSGLMFLKNFIKHPGSVGAVWPSSPYLSKVMVSGLGLEMAGAVVEIGPGTGVVTPFILSKMNPQSKFFAVELNTELYHFFKNKHPELKVYNDDAAHLRTLTDNEGLSNVDAVVSGLPWSTFPPAIQDKILDAVHDVLAPGGVFTTFAYLQGTILPTGVRFKNRLMRHFSKVERTRIEWRNIPPAFCYRCFK